MFDETSTPETSFLYLKYYNQETKLSIFVTWAFLMSAFSFNAWLDNHDFFSVIAVASQVAAP